MSHGRSKLAGASRFTLYISVVSALALILILASNLSLSDKVQTSLVALAVYAANVLSIKVAERDELYRGIAELLSVYISFAYSLKCGVLLNFPDISWLARFAVFSSITPEDLADAFCLSAVGTLSLSLGTVAPSLMHSPKRERARPRQGRVEARIIAMPAPRLKALIAGAWLVLALKAAVQKIYDIGLPGVLPTELPVPYLTGIIAILIGYCLILITNAALFFSLKARNRSFVVWALAAVLCNIYLDVSVGYKLSLVMEVVILSFYARILIPHNGRKNAFLTYGILIAAGLLVCSIFPYINNYRYALIGGSSGWEAVNSAIYYTHSRESSAVIDMFNRINGVDNFLGAVLLADGAQFSIGYLFDSGLNREFIGLVLGRRDLVTAFGLTQFGALYIIGGPFLLTGGSFVLGVALRLLSSILLRSGGRFDGGYAAVAPVITAFWLKLLFSSGDLLLLGKELLLIWVTTIVLFVPVAAALKHSPINGIGAVSRYRP